MEKKKFLFVVEDKNEFYNDMMQEMAIKYSEKSDYDGFIKLHLTDEDCRTSALLMQARDRGLKEVITDGSICPELLVPLIVNSIRYGLDIKDIKTGESIKEYLLDVHTMHRDHEEVGRESRKTLGVLWNNESEELINWYKDYCIRNDLEYAETKHLSTEDAIGVFKFISDAEKQKVGKVLVAGPYYMLSDDKINPLMDMLKESNVEVIDALLDASITDYCCFRNVKRAVLIMVGDDETLRDSMSQHALNNNYEISFGCGLMGDTDPRILMDIIPQIADKQNASTIIIPDKVNFNFKEKQWDELIELLDKNGLQIESVKEGVLEQKAKVTQLMN